MKKLFWPLFIFILVIIVAILGQLSNGNVVIYLGEYKVSFSLNLLIAGWVITLLGAVVVWKALKGTFMLPKSIAAFFTRRRLARVDNMLTQTLADYLAGNYLKSAKIAAKLAKLSISAERQSLCLILAIDAAIRVNNLTNVNKLVDKLNESANLNINQAQKIIRAKSATLNQQYLHAITLLKEVIQLDSKNSAAYQLLLENYIYANDKENAQECLKWLKKRKIFPLYLNEFYQRFGVIN